jgi:hypothetical protein
MEVSGQLHAPDGFTPGTHWIGGCEDPSAGLDAVGKSKILNLLRTEPRPSSP